MNENLELADYQEENYDGLFGSTENQELVKAMIAGQITGRDTADQVLTQEPLKAESLEKTLKLLEFRMKDVKLWNIIPKQTAYNTVEESVQLISYGADVGGFVGEGELSDVQDSKYERRSQNVKFIQVNGEVTLQAQMVRSNFGPAMTKEVENKTMWLIRKISNSLTKADANMVGKEFNGIYEQQQGPIGTAQSDFATLDLWQNSNRVIDLRGASLTQSILEDASVNVDANFGSVDTLVAPPIVMSGLFKDYFDRQRIIVGGSEGVNRGAIGNIPKMIGTQFGDVAIQQDKFTRRLPSRLATDAPTGPKAPGTPTVGTAALTGNDAGSRFSATEAQSPLGTVFYGVSAINEYGESQVRLVGGDTNKVTTTAGLSVDLTVASSGGAYAPLAYIVYRSLPSSYTNAATSNVPLYPIFKVSAAQLAAGFDGAAPASIRDRNRFIPGCEDAFITEMSEEVLSVKQLAPISKLDLAVTNTANRFISFCYLTPYLFTPQKLLRIINIGKFVTYSG